MNQLLKKNQLISFLIALFCLSSMQLSAQFLLPYDLGSGANGQLKITLNASGTDTEHGSWQIYKLAPSCFMR